MTFLPLQIFLAPEILRIFLWIELIKLKNCKILTTKKNNHLLAHLSRRRQDSSSPSDFRRCKELTSTGAQTLRWVTSYPLWIRNTPRFEYRQESCRQTWPRQCPRPRARSHLNSSAFLHESRSRRTAPFSKKTPSPSHSSILHVLKFTKICFKNIPKWKIVILIIKIDTKFFIQFSTAWKPYIFTIFVWKCVT